MGGVGKEKRELLSLFLSNTLIPRTSSTPSAFPTLLQVSIFFYKWIIGWEMRDMPGLHIYIYIYSWRIDHEIHDYEKILTVKFHPTHFSKLFKITRYACIILAYVRNLSWYTTKWKIYHFGKNYEVKNKSKAYEDGKEMGVRFSLRVTRVLTFVFELGVQCLLRNSFFLHLMLFL